MEEKTKHLIESFLWRFYNVFKVSVFPVVAFVLLKKLEERGDISCLLEAQTWQEVIYAVLVSMLTATLAGLDKVQRENIRITE